MAKRTARLTRTSLNISDMLLKYKDVGHQSMLPKGGLLPEKVVSLGLRAINCLTSCGVAKDQAASTSLLTMSCPWRSESAAGTVMMRSTAGSGRKPVLAPHQSSRRSRIIC